MTAWLSTSRTRHNQKPLVRRLQRLIRFRNEYPAFGGDCRVGPTAAGDLDLVWRHGEAACTLHVDLETATAAIAYRDGEGQEVRHRL